MERILEFTLRSEPVLSIKTVCVASIDVELVGPVSDVLGRYDYERRIMCVINQQPFNSTIAVTPVCPGRDVLMKHLGH
jgi:hypothetical protein